MITIKRYSNRKLYDTQAGRYITLEEIAQAVRRGEDLRVVDHASGIDLTTLTYLQVILEEEKKQGGLLPHGLLARLIRAGESRFDAVRRLVTAALEPEEMFACELKRRLELLFAQARLSDDEASRLRQLLLDPELFETEPPPPSPAATSAEIHVLIAEIERMKTAVDELIR